MKNLKDIHLGLKDDWNIFNQHRKKQSKGLATGLSSIDSLVLGLRGVVGIQGEPGSCKSTLALQIALNAVKSNVPVLMIDRENGAVRLRRRILCNLFQQTSKQIDSCTDEQFKTWVNEVREYPFYVDTDPCTLDEVGSYVQQMRDIYQGPLLMIVDSLQALPKGEMDERIALQYWLEGFDQLKLDHKGELVILITSEKKRGAYGESSKEAGKGTNAIEYKCELLFDMREDGDSGLLFLDLVKNRDGATFTGAVLSRKMQSADKNSFLFSLDFEKWIGEDEY